MSQDAQSTRASLLIRLHDARDAEAWEQFVHIYTPVVYGFSRNQGLQDADAADVTQEVLRSVARAMEKFDYDRQRGKFRNWLLTVTRSKLCNFYNRRQRLPEPAGHSAVQALVDAGPTPAEQSSWDTEYHGRLFQWACEELRPKMQETSWQAFWRTTIDQEDAAKVAADLKLSVGAVYVAKSRVLARLREKVQSVDRDADALPSSPQA